MNKQLRCLKHGVDMHVFLRSPKRSGGKSDNRIVAVCPTCKEEAKINDRAAPGFGKKRGREFAWEELSN